MALLAATHVTRRSQFILEAELSSRRRVLAHLPDPGRLQELLRPGARLRLRMASRDSRRQTRYTAALVRAPQPGKAWVSLETSRANRLAEELLQAGRVPGLGEGWTLQREVSRGGSRFDFCLSKAGRARTLVEVKSVTLVAEGLARFPDAPTARGVRHLRELTRRVQEGERALVLFVVQRGDARRVASNPDIDPDFARALQHARGAGVMLKAAHFRFSPSGASTFIGFSPVWSG